jgi:ribosomal protein S18 acetylase RimI-like enzyme
VKRDLGPALPRTATVNDVGAIARVHVQSWRSTYPGLLPERYLSGLDAAQEGQRWARILSSLGTRQTVTVAEEDGEVVGFAFGGPDRDRGRDHRAELYAIYLLEGAQGRGWGRSLLRSVSIYLAAHGMPSMVVWVLRENRRARRFYERMGGVYGRERTLDFDGNSVPEVSYGWRDTRSLNIGDPGAAR